MGPELQGVTKERTTLRVVLTGLVAALFGGALLYLSEILVLQAGNAAAAALVREVGALIVATGLIALLWELWGKRAFLDEIWAKAQLTQTIKSAGIIGFTPSFHQDINWKQLFDSVKKLDILFAYGATWRSLHEHELAEVARKSDVRIRVILPDPDDELAMSELARRFGYKTAEAKRLIQEAQTYFRRLRADAPVPGATIDIWLLRTTPQFTFYRFDDVIVLAPYTHRQRPAQVPAFIVHRHGALYKFVHDDLDAVLDSAKGLARQMTVGEEC